MLIIKKRYIMENKRNQQWTVEEEELLIKLAKEKSPDIKRYEFIANIKNQFDKSAGAINMKLYILERLKRTSLRRNGVKNYDSLICKAVSENKENLGVAFRKVAEETGLCYATICKRWYSFLKKREGMFSISSKDGGYVNCKNVHVGTEEKYKKLQVQIENPSEDGFFYTVVYPMFVQTSTY